MQLMQQLLETRNIGIDETKNKPIAGHTILQYIATCLLLKKVKHSVANRK